MKVINLFAGPCSGKSTTAAGLFYYMKLKNLRVELVTEYAKDIVYSENWNQLENNQIYIFAEQQRRLKILDGKVDWAIMDSPLLFSSIYGPNESELYHDFVIATFLEYENINIFIDRPTFFSEEGRNHDELQSLALDKHIIELLDENKIPFIHIQADQNTVGNILSHLKL